MTHHHPDARLPIRGASPRALAQRRGARGDRGAMALELALVAPFAIVMLLLVVGFGRVSHGRQLVDQAAAAAARSAALTTTPATATAAGQEAASNTLAQAGISCTALDARIDTLSFHAGGHVTATVSCTADLSGLAMAGMPGSITLHATSRAPLEPFRDFGG
jgi:Flp pilus assembly protein TadG